MSEAVGLGSSIAWTLGGFTYTTLSRASTRICHHGPRCQGQDYIFYAREVIRPDCRTLGKSNTRRAASRVSRHHGLIVNETPFDVLPLHEVVDSTRSLQRQTSCHLLED